jgi:glycosyltransferase involved in cell wall biosynthesis
MRVAALTAERYRALGDAPTRASALWGALGRQGLDVHIVHPELTPIQEWRAKLRHLHPRRAAWRHRYLLSRESVGYLTDDVERRLAAAGDVDVILQYQCLFAPGRRRRAPVAIYTDHVYEVTRREYPRWSPLSRRASQEFLAHESETLRGADVLLTFSEYTRSAAVEHYGCDPERVHVVGTGANVVVADTTDRRYDQRVAFFAGYDFERKGGDVLLKAWPRVRRSLPDARLRIASLPRAPRLPDGVEWLGTLTRHELNAAYMDASVFVLPSRFEPFGLVFAEAMGSGLACVATRTCGVPEIVLDGETGLLVPFSDPNALADALIALLGDPDRARRMGVAAQERVHGHFTWEHVAGRVATHLEAAVGQP